MVILPFFTGVIGEANGSYFRGVNDDVCVTTRNFSYENNANLAVSSPLTPP